MVISLACSMTAVGQADKFSTYYHQRRTLFEKLPDTRNEIIFLGNSITDGCEWSELFDNSRVKNRGISGDVTEGVLFRLDEVTRSQPQKIFLLIGINDLAGGIPKETVFGNIGKIAQQIRTSSPKTEVYIQSILPVNNSFAKFQGHTGKTEEVLWINQQLKQWCLNEGFIYVDLFSHFKCSDSNLMNPRYTNDGLHLTGEGYLLWRDVIAPLLGKRKK